MKHFFLRTTTLALALWGAVGVAQAALPVGAAAPDFTAEAALGGKEFTFSLKKALAHGPVVLYFYPKSFTSGCTAEAHAFAEASASANAPRNPPQNKMCCCLAGTRCLDRRKSAQQG